MAERHRAPKSKLLVRQPRRARFCWPPSRIVRSRLREIAAGQRSERLPLRAQASSRQHAHGHRERMRVVDGERGRGVHRKVEARHSRESRRCRVDRERHRPDIRQAVLTVAAVGIGESHGGRIISGHGEDALRADARRARDPRSLAEIEDLELRAHADALRVRAARKRPLPVGRGLRLDRQHPADDLFDVGRFGRALSLETNRVDFFVDERHLRSPSSLVLTAAPSGRRS